MSLKKTLVDYILSLDGGVEEFREKMRSFDLPPDVSFAAHSCRGLQGRQREIAISKPTLYKIINEIYPDLHPQKVQKARELLAAGMSVSKTAQTLDVSRMTIYRWREKWTANTPATK